MSSLTDLRVDVHMLLQANRVAECFPADAAAERSHPTVGPPDVDLQPMGRGKDLKANDQTVTEGTILLLKPEPNTHLVAGDAVVGVGSGGVVGAAVQGLLRRWAAADVGAVQTAGVLQDRGAEAQLAEIVGGSQLIPGKRWLVIRRILSHVRLCGKKRN